MVRNVISLVTVTTFLFSTLAAGAENSNVPTKKTRDRASRVMNSLLPGPPEIPCNTDPSAAVGANSDRCACRTKSRIENGIVSVVGGVWQIATFWCPDTECAENKR